MLPAALAAADLIRFNGSYVTKPEAFRIAKIDWFANWDESIANEGPLIFGIADAALSDSEIEECIEARPSKSSDPPASERARRAVWPFGISYNTAGGGKITHEGTMKLNWSFSEDRVNSQSNWCFWLYNIGDAALTSGTKFELFAKIFGVWLN